MELTRTHPEHQARSRVWTYNKSHYEGGRALIEQAGAAFKRYDGTAFGSYLTKYELESNDGYSARLARAPGLYENLPKFALATYNSQLFRVEPRRVLPPALEELVKDVDLRRTNATDFFYSVATNAQLYGISFVLVDAPAQVIVQDAQSGEPRELTEYERQQNRLRPWFEEVSPFQVLDWEIELQDNLRRGQLKWVVIQDPTTQRDGPGSETKSIDRYRIYWPDRYEVWVHGGSTDEADRLVQSGTHAAGEVPLIAFYDRREGPMCGTTIIDDVAMSANALWNAASSRDESYLYQAFNQLIVRSNDKTLGELKLGSNRAIKLSDPSDEAYYLTPSAVPFDAFAALRTEIVERTRDLVFNRTQRQMDTAQVESAEKRQMDRDEFIALLQRKAGNFEQSETQCWQLAARFAGLEPDNFAEGDLSIDYNRDFSIIVTMADEWTKRINSGVARAEEWMQELQPGLTLEEATTKIEENLTLASKRSTGTMAQKAVVDSASMYGNADDEKPGEDEGTPPLKLVK